MATRSNLSTPKSTADGLLIKHVLNNQHQPYTKLSKQIHSNERPNLTSGLWTIAPVHGGGGIRLLFSFNQTNFLTHPVGPTLEPKVILKSYVKSLLLVLANWISVLCPLRSIPIAVFLTPKHLSNYTHLSEDLGLITNQADDPWPFLLSYSKLS